MGRKQWGKRRKCWLPAFSPFPTMFSKGYLFRVVKSHDCVVRSELSTKQQPLDLSKLKNICRRQNECECKLEVCFGKSRKHCEKRRDDDYQNFLLFPLCFQKLSFPGSSKVCMVKGLTHYHTVPHFDALKICSCRKHSEKRRKCL